jgi:ABC-2 type transport system ATP-binding protein
MKDICSLVGIDDVYSKVIKNLSKVYKQRVGFAQALVGDPKILILDEPTVGLDPRQIAEIRSLIRKLGKRHTVILSSHILPEIQAVCDRIVVINHGKIVANDTEENILTSFEGEKKLFLTVEGAGRDAIRSALERLPGVKSVSFSKERKGSLDVEITAQKDSDIRKDVFDTAAGNGWTILEMRSSKLTLEEIFIRLTENGTQVQEEVG